MKLNEDFLLKMRDATTLLQTNGPAEATAAIQRALRGMPEASPTTSRRPAPMPDATIHRAGFNRVQLREAAIIDAEVVEETAPGPAQFLKNSLRNHAGSRDYKIFIPGAYNKTNNPAHPLIVMLHGCKQNPDDFAMGTQMNEIAEEHGCIVVYPAQAQAKNMSNCWNWFSASNQQRDQGEPSIIADITRRVMDEYNVDRARVYVTGLSAGGAMAAIMGTSYPEIFAAVGVHSGLAVGAAHDVASAFGAMQNGASQTLKSNSGDHSLAPPIIVFHGDADQTVHPKNAAQILSQFMPNNAANEVETILQNDQAINGMRYSQTVYRNPAGSIIAENWLVYGAGHAWSGGSASGSYTNTKGPDASREMVRFFLARINLK